MFPARVIAGALALIAMAGLLAGAPAGSSGAGIRSQAASACPGRLLEKTAGGSLTEELIAHGAGPETEIVRLCSASGGRRYSFPEGPQGYGYSFLFAGLTFAGDQTAALAWTWFREAPELWVVDLATDRVLFKKALPSDPAHPETIEVGKIVLQRDGSVAWTELSPSGACEVVEHTSHGTHVLNPTRKAQPTSLTLVGTTLRWLEQDGQVRTATLR